MFTKYKLSTISWVLFLILLINPAFSALTDTELRDYNKRLASRDSGVIYQLVHELNEKNESHRLILNGLRLLLKKDFLDDYFKIFIAETLCKLGGTEGLAYLEEIIVNKEEEYYRKCLAIKSLGKSGNKDALPILEQLEDSPDLYLRICAIASMLALGKKYPTEELLNLFNQASSEGKRAIYTYFDEKDPEQYTDKDIVFFTKAACSRVPSIAHSAFNKLVLLEDSLKINTIITILNNIKIHSVRIKAELYLISTANHPIAFILNEYKELNVNGRTQLLYDLFDYKEDYPEALQKVIQAIELEESDYRILEDIDRLQNAAKPTAPSSIIEKMVPEKIQ